MTPNPNQVNPTQVFTDAYVSQTIDKPSLGSTTGGTGGLGNISIMPHQTGCPNCGYCPHCGRSGQPGYGNYWTYPYGPTITCGQSNLPTGHALGLNQNKF